MNHGRSSNLGARLTRFHDPARRDQDEQSALGAGVPAVFIDLLEIVRDSRLVRSEIALPIDGSLDPALSIKRHGIRDTGDKNFAGRAALAGEDGVLRDK